MLKKSQEKILLDVGSSTVKVYKLLDGNLSLTFSRSLPFKENFSEDVGISDENKTQLYELVSEIQDRNKDIPIKIYATALFRKMTPKARELFIDEFYERTGLYFNIISQDLESFYLELALVGKYPKNDNVLLINIGGGSTELVVMYGKEAIETVKLDFGVGTILNEFPKINSTHSEISAENIVEKLKERLPALENKVSTAFYTGGELSYMNVAKYNLQPNTLFKDLDHPKIITASDFFSRNKDIFSKITLDTLRNMMPENPNWMNGARSCSALAQAIVDKYNISTIIPSNSNLIDGVIRQEVRYVTLSGSFRKHLDYILAVRKALVDKGVKVLSPQFTEPKNPGDEFVVFSGEEGRSPLQLERHHLDSIDNSDALIVCSKEGYVGASALIEIGYAQALGKRIIFTEAPEEFMLKTLPSEVGL